MSSMSFTQPLLTFLYCSQVRPKEGRRCASIVRQGGNQLVKTRLVSLENAATDSHVILKREDSECFSTELVCGSQPDLHFVNKLTEDIYPWN